MMPVMADGYPAHREADVVLRDGSTVLVRPVRPDDGPALRAFLTGLSEEARWLRFFAGTADLERAAELAADVDHHDRFGLVALHEGAVIGHAVFLRTAPDRAECAFAVADAFQGRGLGTILLGQLAEAAAQNGVRIFDADVLPQNHRMVRVFRDSGFPIESRSRPGLIRVSFPTSLTERALAHFEERDRNAAVAAVGALLAPRAVAVIGASRHRGTIGGEVFHNLLEEGFQGPVYPVNPKADVVQSVAAYPSIRDVPGPVDLAVIVVPAEAAVEVARECGRAGVRSLVVISAGFAETGLEGAARQAELLGVCREAGMRLVGPNCMGIISTAPDVRLNATFSPVFPVRGRVGFLSQSGALGLAVIDHAGALGLGLSSFVSVGNKADISGNDMIRYWEADEDTDLILLYLESFGNPRKFSTIARRVARSKPIVAVKSGRSRAGARATGSHTGALIAASDVTVEALFHQAGVIRTDTLGELFDVASLLANQPAPAGDRVAIVTNAGGPGILCADACEANGLSVAELPPDVQAELARFLPAEAAVSNPVDMIASASAEDFERAIRVVGTSGAVDGLIVVFVPPLVTRAEDVARGIRAAARNLPGDLPLLSVFMQSRGVPPELRSEAIPSYAFPEDAARALAAAARYGRWRAAPEGTVPGFEDLRTDEATAIVASALGRGAGWLAPGEASGLLDCYGIPLAPQQVVATPREAGRAAAGYGGPVALKAVAPGLVHKTEAGAVALSVDPADVESAAQGMADAMASSGHPVEAFLVQPMMPGGVEMLVGVVQDPVFGPVVACGAGGTAVELLKDVQVRIAPLTDLDADEMIHGLATFPLLEGHRGAAPADVPALRDVLLRVSALVDAHPEVVELDCNPVVVRPDGAVVVDARVRVEPSAPPPPVAARGRRDG
jgi:acetyl coenzyme A synthetase (ADP forming)-like protein